MKVRSDFVTNSSSSSFIISKDHVSHDKLLKILFEIANKEAKHKGYDGYTWDEDVKDDVVAYRYHIIESTPDNPYNRYDDYYYYSSESTQYDNHFIIDNDCCVRYNWDIVKEVLKKYNIPWEFGDCD